MKLLESQNALLSNYEVYKHLKDQAARDKKQNRPLPDGLKATRKATLQWLQTHPSPFSQQPITYTEKSIPTLIQRLRPYDLSKGEVIMIINLRPSSIVILNLVIEDLAERLTAEQQEEVLTIITEVLGKFDPPSEATGQFETSGETQEAADISMADG